MNINIKIPNKIQANWIQQQIKGLFTETRPISYTITKINLKWIKRPTCKTGNHETLRKKSIEQKLFDMDLANDFLDMTPEVQATKTISKWGYIKLKSFA